MTWTTIQFTSSQEQGEESLQIESVGQLPSQPVRSTRMLDGLSLKTSIQDFYQCFPFGTTLRPCATTTQTAAERSTGGSESEIDSPSAEDSPAKTLAWQARALELMEIDPVSGAKCSAWFAKWDQDTSSWRTSQRSLLGDWIEYSETWPRQGMMQSGVCSVLPKSVLHITERESGYWHTPTPTVNDSRSGRNRTANRTSGSKHHDGVTLTDYVTMLPTPTASDATSGGCYGNGSLKLGGAVQKMVPTPCASDGDRAGTMTENMTGQSLPQFVRKMLATPSARDWKDTPGMSMQGENPDGSSRSREDQLPRQVFQMENARGGQLNPTWVEWLMGFPIGYTACESSETHRCLSLLLSPTQSFEQWLNTCKADLQDLISQTSE